MPLNIVFLRPREIGLDENPITKALLPPSRFFKAQSEMTYKHPVLALYGYGKILTEGIFLIF